MRGRREGSIVKRSDGRWAGAVEIDGRRRWVYGRTRSEVAAKLGELVRMAEAGISVSADRITVGVYLERWLEDSVKPRVRPKTYRGYEQLVRIHLVPALGRVRLPKLSPMQVQQLVNVKLDAGLSPRTVQYMRAVLRAALAQAVRWRLVPFNAAALADGPTVRRKAVPALTPADAQVLLEAVAGDRLEALVVVALGLGLRQGEALGLRWPDVDLDGQQVLVRDALQRVKGAGLRLVPVKTDLSQRALPLPAIVGEALRRQRERQALDRMVAGRRWQDTGFVFTSAVGTPMDGSNVTHKFQALLSAGGAAGHAVL